MKLLFPLFWMVIFCEITTPVAGQSKYTPQTYIQKFKDYGELLMKQWGIPASVILGVAFLESGTGNSKDAHVLHNQFGIKGFNQFRVNHHGFHSMYKQYPADEDSFLDFCKIISSKRFYPKMKESTSYTRWIARIRRSNYAEADTIWSTRIIKIIRKYKLYRLDSSMVVSAAND